MPLKKKRKEKKACSWGSQPYEGATTSQTITALQRASLSLRGSWCWKLWLTRFFKALLHLPYFRAAVPFPNHKWLGHVHKDRYSHLRFNLWDRLWRGARWLMQCMDCIKSPHRRSDMPPECNQRVKYVVLIFINFLVVVICLKEWGFFLFPQNIAAV